MPVPLNKGTLPFLHITLLRRHDNKPTYTVLHDYETVCLAVTVSLPGPVRHRSTQYTDLQHACGTPHHRPRRTRRPRMLQWQQ